MAVKPTYSVPDGASFDEGSQALSKQREEHFQDVAADLRKRLPAGYDVTVGKHWKGFGMTLHLPRKAGDQD